MNQDMLNIGKKIEISITRNEITYVFPSKVEDMTPGNLLVGMPLKGNETFPVALGEKININFLYRDLPYCVDGIVMSKSYHPIPVMLVKLEGTPYKIQRRDYFRLKVSLTVELMEEGSENHSNGLIKDLSASGALLAVKKVFRKGDSLIVKFKLGEDLLQPRAIVKRVEKQVKSAVYPYAIAVHFKDLNEYQKEIIIKFILEEQRKLRQKGLL